MKHVPNCKHKKSHHTRCGIGAIEGERVVVLRLNKTQAKLIYNTLKMYRGDFPEVYKGSDIWRPEVEVLMGVFPEDIKF